MKLRWIIMRTIAKNPLSKSFPLICTLMLSRKQEIKKLKKKNNLLRDELKSMNNELTIIITKVT